MGSGETMVNVDFDEYVDRWKRSALRRRDAKRPAENQARLAAACGTSGLRVLVPAVRTASSTSGWAGPMPRSRV